MLANDYMLQVVSQRLDFWRDQLQHAFRSGDGERVAECTRLIEEYSWVLAEALKPATERPPVGRVRATRVGTIEEKQDTAWQR